jgi:hypothetical protein
MPAPVIAAAIGGVIITLLRIYAVSLIGRILLTMGIGLFAYKVGVPELLDYIASKFVSLSDFQRASLARSGIDVFLTMILSAMAVKKTASVFFGRSPL